ncbi:MAG: ATP-dependent DNA helicase [Candidatus Aenigmarchaeota archaeon]|nr:ATP-dependent DNA helicase [Candidatus Aenigmarchaeota archaeon]
MIFPYPSLREQQKELINDVKTALARGQNLLADAPTGLGKTIAALYPSIEYALENNKIVFFLTARHSQHKMAVETLQKIRQHTDIGAVDIIGKKWLCSYDVDKMDSSMFNNFCNGMVKNKNCAFLAATRESVKEKELKESARKAIQGVRKEVIHSEDFKARHCKEFCCYELLMEAAKKSNVIIGDYFHIFSPIGEAFFKKMEKEIEDSIIIVDEAHNLPSRIRDRLSSKISIKTIRFAIEEAKEFGHDDIVDLLERLQNIFDYLSRHMAGNEAFVSKQDFLDHIEKYSDVEQLTEDFYNIGKDVLREKKRSSIDHIASFIEQWSGPDNGYARILSKEGKDVVLYYNCLDPSIISRPKIENSHSTIMMSGTLQPIEMFADVLGFDRSKTTMKRYSSPFQKQNRLDIIIGNITTLYKERNEKTFQDIANMVRSCSRNIRGNAAVFFPSYDILKKVFYEIGSLEKQIIVETQGMSKKEKMELYDEFASYSDKGGAVLFAVMAGSFSEGIDLPGNLLNGVIIVGIPFGRPDKNTEALIAYYDRLFKKGKEYGYVYPAMIKVIQAAGRCIRTENDRGVCIFADKRYLWSSYRRFLPDDIKTANNTDFLIKDFFQ